MNQRFHVFLTHPHVACWNFQERHKNLLENSIPGAEVKLFFNSREFLSQLSEADTVLVWYFKKDWLAGGLRLKLISTPAAGKDWLDIPEPDEDRSAPEIWHGGFHGSMMAESVLGAALSFIKAFEFSRKMQGQKKWARIKVSDRIASLHNSRVTLLGFGRIGEAIGKAFKPFGCQITGIKRSVDVNTPEWFGEGDCIKSIDQLQEVLPETDHLILALPGGEATDGLLTAHHFDLLNGEVCFYNVGRGNPYREDDIVAALKSRKIRQAYLDVFDTEPLPETSPLWELDNVLIQPHLSAASPHYLDLYVEEFIARWKKENR